MTTQDGTLDLYGEEAKILERERSRIIYYFDVPKKLAKECGVAKVGFVQLSTSEELQAARRAGNSSNGGRATQGDAAFELTKESLRVVDGKRVNTGDGSAETFWGRLDPGFPKLRQLLVTAYADLHNVDDGDSESFGQQERSSLTTLTALYLALLHEPPIRRSIFRLYAFVGRYGHQSIRDMGDMNRADLTVLAEEVAAIMSEEKSSNELVNPD